MWASFESRNIHGTQPPPPVLNGNFVNFVHKSHQIPRIALTADRRFHFLLVSSGGSRSSRNNKRWELYGSRLMSNFLPDSPPVETNEIKKEKATETTSTYAMTIKKWKTQIDKNGRERNKWKKKFQRKDIFIHGPQRYDPRFQAPA